MPETTFSKIIELKQKSLIELQEKYKELFGKNAPSSNNKLFLWRKIAQRIQESTHASFSETASNRIQTFIKQYDPINNKALRPKEAAVSRETIRDLRLPIPGTVITKEYKGRTIEVKILEKGFEYNGRPYRSLTAIAKEITGDHWNGYLFFNL
jgi:hypothetical protein